MTTEELNERVEDVESEPEFDDDEEEEEEEIIRCKWVGDGANTLDELIEKLEEYKVCIRNLKAQGWELVRPMDDDYGFMRKVEVFNTEEEGETA